MSKGKTKAQKKKFFSHPQNRNKVFKKKEKPAQEAGTVLRRRGNYEVLQTEEGQEVPQCSHGPCLLFGRKENNVISQRYFSCAVHRGDLDACAFKQPLHDDGSLGEPEVVAPVVEKGKWNYACIPKKLKSIPKESTLVFCRECNDVFEKKHKCPSEIVTREQLKMPSRFLTALDAQSGEAQYFFSDESLSVLLDSISRSTCDGVLCLGSPRIMESVKAMKDGKNVFMLDYDRRYAHFYPSTQFAQYSMLVDHFFDPKAEAKLVDFMSRCSSLLLVCDPPFGVFIEPLMHSVQKLATRYTESRQGQATTFSACILVPLFVGKHILRLDSKLWMSDYRVTYDNHKLFNKANKTTVRIFTNLSADCIDLSQIKGYNFCDMCEKFVAESNKHCFMCGYCTSKDGSPYHHCQRCSRCVKNSYKHCAKCSRCHLPGRCLPESAITDE